MIPGAQGYRLCSHIGGRSSELDNCGPAWDQRTPHAKPASAKASAGEPACGAPREKREQKAPAEGFLTGKGQGGAKKKGEG